MRARAALLPDGRRLHLQDGPIDLVIEAVGHDGPPSPSTDLLMLRSAAGASRSTRNRPACFEAPLRSAPQREDVGGLSADLHPSVGAAYQAATLRFASVLDELCAELPQLRAPAPPGGCPVEGRIARRMWSAVLPFAVETFITPMAAVAGTVADEILAAMIAAAPLARASVNNGGDIALHLAPGESFRIGLVDRPDQPGLFASATLRQEDGIGGVATSGWRGRSFSLGIADAVTILARSAAEADAAATIVANAVDLPGHPAVSRTPASEVQCDSDLGERLVTRGVGPLSKAEIDEALGRGLACAERLVARGLIQAAALHLQGVTSVARAFPPPCGEGRVALQARTGVGVATSLAGPLPQSRPDPHPAREGGYRLSRVRPPRKGEGRRELVS